MCAVVAGSSQEKGDGETRSWGGRWLAALVPELQRSVGPSSMILGARYDARVTLLPPRVIFLYFGPFLKHFLEKDHCQNVF